MTDFPAHASALYVLMHAHDPDLSRFYQTEWDLVPDLASEILVPLMAKVMPLFASVKMFVSLGLAMWVLAPFAIHYALYRRVGIAALAGSLFAYNAAFTWGFINFYFAVGFALLLFAAWIGSERKTGVLRTVSFALAATVLLYAHALGLLLFGLLLFFFELMPAVEGGRKAFFKPMGTVVLVLLPAVTLFLFFRPAAADVHQFSLRLLESLPGRLESTMQNRFDTAAYGPLAVLILLLLLGVWRKRLSLHPRMIPVLCALGVFCFFAPSMAGGGWGVHIRFPAALCLLLCAAMEVRLAEKFRPVLGVLFLALGISNATMLYLSWRDHDRQYAEFRTAMQLVPPASRLFTVLDRKASGRIDMHPYRHMAEYAIIDRSAFVPLMFTTRGQHVVHTRPEYEPISSQTSLQGHEARLEDLASFAQGDFTADKNLTYLNEWPCNYDQVIVIHMGKPQSPVPEMLRLKQSFSFFSLYEVVRPQLCKSHLIREVRAEHR